MKKLGLIILLTFFVISLASAHNPRYVIGKNNSETNPIIISYPEISQAFYGDLNEKPDYYILRSAKNFSLYLNILAPVTNPYYYNSKTNFVVEIYKNSKLIDTINGNNHQWTQFHEEFGGDDYLMGPELSKNYSSGVYIIKVSNTDNKGRYSLAIGETESFKVSEYPKTIYLLYLIKTKFFSKSLFAIFQGIIGKMLIALITLIIFLIIGIILLIKYFTRKKVKLRIN